MSEILLQTIVEKLEAFEIALFKETNSGEIETINKQLLQEIQSFQAAFTRFNSHVTDNEEKLNSLSQNIRALGLQLDNSKQNQVRHIHHLHKPAGLTVILFIISLFLVYEWNHCNDEKKSFEANDIKYRYLKADGNASLLKILHYTDSLYNLDTGDFKKRVLDAERKIADQILLD